MRATHKGKSMTKLFNDRQNVLFTIILVSGLVWIWISADREGASTQEGTPAPNKGFLAPDFELTSLDGNVTQLSDVRGKPVVVNFWASWCIPCRTEMPAIERAYLQRQKDVVVLGVNATSQDNLSEVENFVHDTGLSFPILLDHHGEVMDSYRVSALPTTFFVDRNGIIQDVVIGGPMAEALLTSRLEDLLRKGK
jgi:peroxiredoxin